MRAPITTNNSLFQSTKNNLHAECSGHSINLNLTAVILYNETKELLSYIQFLVVFSTIQSIWTVLLPCLVFFLNIVTVKVVFQRFFNGKSKKVEE